MTDWEIARPGAQWLPPHPRPFNESAGYLGYYCRSHLKDKFDIVDFDGTWPACWTYSKSATRTFRIFEEKLGSQNLHPSQQRVYRTWHDLIGLGREHRGFGSLSGVYVIREAERLLTPQFPVRVSRIGSTGWYDSSRDFDRDEFDSWILG